MSIHRVCYTSSMDSFTLVIFGFTSNLAQIKLIPALYNLMSYAELSGKFSIIGIGRTPMDPTTLRTYITTTLHAHKKLLADEVLTQKLVAHTSYLSIDLTDRNSYQKLKATIQNEGNHNLMIYLATFPSLYHTILDELHIAGITAKEPNNWPRIMVEKPLGTDQSSAQEMNALFTKYFVEDQIFRLDHYLGKETLQNILTFRFGNGIFEPLMNHEYIDHIQETCAEDYSVGKRGSYYDQTGHIKDVGQNHHLQMVALATMETPATWNNNDITKSRIQVFKDLVPEPDSLITGQYAGYQQEKDVTPDSTTETFFAFKTRLNNDRFRGVPIYMRGGKCMKRTATEVTIVFKDKPNPLFPYLKTSTQPNVLIYRIQPNEGIVLKIMTKKPGHTLTLEESYMQYCYAPGTNLPSEYEHLILDALNGEQTFFNDADEIDAQWAFIDPIITATHLKKPTIYAPGSWGPAAADAMIAADGRAWLEPSTAFCNY